MVNHMESVLPKTFVIDTNFFVSFHNTGNNGVLKVIADFLRKSDFSVFAPKGVLNETSYETKQKLKIIVESAFTIENVNYEDELYKRIRKESIDRNCFKSDEKVDLEVLYLAYIHSQSGGVGIITFDMGFKRALEVVPLLKKKKIHLITPWRFLLEIYKLSDTDLRKKLKDTIKSIYNYFYKFRLERGRETTDMITEIIESALNSLDVLALLNFEIPREEFVAIEKYLSSQQLSESEKLFVKDIKGVLDGIKLARESTDFENIETGLDIAFSQLEKLKFNKSNEDILKYLNLLHQLSNQIRGALIQKYVATGDYEKAIAHIEILRVFNLTSGSETDVEMVIKMDTLLGFLHILQGNYKQALELLRTVKEKKPLDPEGFMTLLIAYIALDKSKEANELLGRLNEEYPQLTESLIDLAHNFIRTHRYELAAKLLLKIKDCKQIPNDSFKEKISILLRIDKLNRALRKELEQCIEPAALKDHTDKPLDKTFYCKDCDLENVHSFFKDRMIIVGAWPNPDGSLFVKVWNERLKSMLGVIVPPISRDMVTGALSIRLLRGKIKKIRDKAPKERRTYKVRGVIELCDETVIEVEKWKNPLG